MFAPRIGEALARVKQRPRIGANESSFLPAVTRHWRPEPRRAYRRLPPVTRASAKPREEGSTEGAYCPSRWTMALATPRRGSGDSVEGAGKGQGTLLTRRARRPRLFSGGCSIAPSPPSKAEKVRARLRRGRCRRWRGIALWLPAPRRPLPAAPYHWRLGEVCCSAGTAAGAQAAQQSTEDLSCRRAGREGRSPTVRPVGAATNRSWHRAHVTPPPPRRRRAPRRGRRSSPGVVVLRCNRRLLNHELGFCRGHLHEHQQSAQLPRPRPAAQNGLAGGLSAGVGCGGDP